jgi:hypothetical protein
MFMLAKVVTRAFMNPIKITGFCFVVTALAVLAEPINAQLNGQFKVTVNLQSSKSYMGSCINGSMVSMFGSKVSMACITGLTNSGAYGFLYLANVKSLGAIDAQAQMNSYFPVGSLTTWRLVHLSYLNYVEIQIGW